MAGSCLHGGRYDIGIAIMKLFVYGEHSGDPDTWFDYPWCRTLIVARDESEARILAGLTENDDEVYEVDVSKPKILAEMMCELKD